MMLLIMKQNKQLTGCSFAVGIIAQKWTNTKKWTL